MWYATGVAASAPWPTFNLADLFEVVVDAVPDRMALIAGDRRLTYADLDARANRFARVLTGAGVAPGEHIAILSWNRAEWVEAFFGCFKARAVPINLSYRYTASELRHVLVDSDAVAVVHEGGFDGVLD